VVSIQGLYPHDPKLDPGRRYQSASPCFTMLPPPVGVDTSQGCPYQHIICKNSTNLFVLKSSCKIQQMSGLIIIKSSLCILRLCNCCFLGYETLFNPKNGSNKLLRQDSNHLPDYTVSLHK